MKTVKEKVAALLEVMEKKHIDFYVIPTADFHNSEYVSDYFKVREYMSGFTGSNGTLVINREECGLWTDGRYFVQADIELKGSGIQLFRMAEEGVPTIPEYLKLHAADNDVIAFDGRVVEACFGSQLEELFADTEVGLQYEEDIVDNLWVDRPELPHSKIWNLTDEQAGKSVSEKLAEIRTIMKKENTEQFVLSKLDDIMWLYNIRANDVEFNPVALAYTVLTLKEAYLFVQQDALTEQVETFLKNSGVIVKDYHDITSFLQNYQFKGKTLLDKNYINYLLYKIVSSKSEVVCRTNPTTDLKAIKNEVELRNIREVYIRDSAVLTKFLMWMKQNVGKVDMTEVSVARKLDSMRSEIEGFLDLSFPTISAYRENAAMMHYEASEEHETVIRPEGLYLVDSGGQYMQGTTDVTRTIALGEITEDMKKHFTKAVCGMLRLTATRFLYGCSGKNVDIMAREPLWECYIDYKCGTGHGIGYILNVHEGPQNIRWRYLDSQTEAILEEGMIVSNEPGVYIEGSHGIRIENIMEIVKEVKNGDGQFMGFRTLTYVPIDLDAIDTKYMEPRDIELLNAYHQQVYEKLAPFMQDEELVWLKDATKTILS